MSAITDHPPAVRLPTSEALLQKRRGWFFGLTGDEFVKYVFQGNATISIIVLGLITFTIFKDAVGFIPQNHANLKIYRLAGLEFVDLFREQVTAHSTISRYLASVRSQQLELLTKKEGLAPAAALARLAEFDAFANRFADTINEQEALLGTMSDLVTAVKERQKVAEDMVEAKQNLLGGMRGATPERAAHLQKEADAVQIEILDFKAEIQPLLALRPEIAAVNERQVAAMQVVAAAAPKFSDAELNRRMDRFQDFVRGYYKEMEVAAQKMAAWDQTRPISWLEAFNAFAFGREWVTASFWQDWYGIIPLLTGSLLIAFMALLIAIPLGVAAAIYVNQVARPTEQKFIKPYIEFISAIPSVVLGFFGIAMLGETLRRLSQLPSLGWVPGFPMAERLNATTAACLLALMAIPTIFSLAEDAINNVPRSFKEASFALGATRLQTIINITIPAALSGIMAAILLGFGRVIGETMVVLLCAGNRIQTPDLGAGLGVIFQPVHTMTGIIAQEMGEVVRNSIHYRALFMIGVVLFLISLLINWLAQKIVRRYPDLHRMKPGTTTAAAIFGRPTAAKRAEQGVFWLLRLATYFVLLCGAVIFIDIGVKGGAVIFQASPPFINVPFLTESPETLNVFELDGKKRTMGDREFRQFKATHEAELKGVHVDAYVYSAGGIFPNIVGTILLTTGSILIALVLGVLSAIYLSEYATDGPFIRFLRLSIINLAGVPSIVFGLFGFGLFVIAFDFGVSLLAGWLTLAFMVLPIIITASEEALKAVPKGYREGSLALGATKFQTITTNVLPYALPGILTSSVLSIARVSGETAAIMFTAAFVMRDELPWQVQQWTDFFQGVMALPYHIYVVASKIPQNEYTRDVQYGTAFVFLFTVAAIAMTAVILRQRLRKKYQW